MVSIVCFKSSSVQHDVNDVNDGPIYFKIDDKAGYAFRQDYLVIDRSLPQRVSVQFMLIVLKDTLGSLLLTVTEYIRLIRQN